MLKIIFLKTESGAEPVREWLQALSKDERSIIGYDIHLVQEGWPIGKPLVDSLGHGLWEVRSRLRNRIARVIFYITDGRMVLLHGFIKKTKTTPVQDIDLAKKRKQFHAKGELQ